MSGGDLRWRVVGQLLNNVGALEKELVHAKVVAITIRPDGQEIINQLLRTPQGSTDHPWQKP